MDWMAGGGLLRRSAALVAAGIACALALAGVARAQTADALDAEVVKLYQAGKYAEATNIAERRLAIREKAQGPDHRDVGETLSNLAGLYLAQGRLAEAAEGSSKGEARQLRSHFVGLVKMTHRLAAEGRSPRSSAADMFETAQWAQASDAAASLAQMAARSATGSPELAGIVRERQDLVSEWQLNDKLLIAAKSEEPLKRKPEAEKTLADRLAAIDARLGAINRKLAKDFPDYAALVSPAPISVAEVQAQLRADEALVAFLDTPEVKRAATDAISEESFVWVVTKSEVRWVRSELGTAALATEVAALRCGLDEAAWAGAGAERCAKALGRVVPDETPNPLPFDHARAHRLYVGLFGEVRDLIAGKHLLIVPSGALTQLPFQVLVTEAPSQGLTPHRAVAWLARSNAITVLPAVSSLKALRRVGRPSAAPKPLVGFGNPLLDGPDDRYSGRANLAQARQRCPVADPQQVAALAAPRRAVARVATRAGLVDVADIKQQTPLPETAFELCAVAANLRADLRDIHLGGQATEREIKRLSASGELAAYRIVHFATHGAAAGDLDRASEPGLILTPPDAGKASDEDDGYLSASEIAALRLDADWVVLSACNTAAGAANNAEALSGLARAFIYAGARALLVSHWAVDSDATVKLVTTAAAEMARDAKVGRAEALRRAMLALIEKGATHEAHPAYWAPFVVVGEGAAAR
jgi:CHAT domain-containing protein